MDVRSAMPLLKHSAKCDCEACTKKAQWLKEQIAGDAIREKVTATIVLACGDALISIVKDIVDKHPTGDCAEIYGELIPEIQKGIAGAYAAMGTSLTYLLSDSDYARGVMIVNQKEHVDVAFSEAIKLNLNKLYEKTNPATAFLSALLEGMGDPFDFEGKEPVDRTETTH